MGVETTTRRRYLGALGATVSAGLAGCSGILGGQNAAENGSATGTSKTDRTTPENPTNGTNANARNPTAGNASADESPFTRVYRNAIGSVVLIKVTTPRGVAEGTGFAYDPTHIVTNAHVVENANAIRLRFSNDAYRDATVVGTDVSSDLAVLETRIPNGIEALPIHPDQPAIGTEVLAIGNPYGNYGTASAGIVSAVNRSIPAQNGYTIPDAIQTDAAVNPGNSGGPLMDLDGEVLGVVNSGRRGSQNIAFAISAALLQRVVPALIENGAYHHAYVGVGLEALTPSRANRLGLNRDRGVYVARVVSGGPADGTLRAGDVIVRIGGEKIDTRQQLSSYLALRTSPKDTVKMTVVRNGNRRTVSLTLGRRPTRTGRRRPTTTR